MSDEEWVPFTHRYGIAEPLSAARWDTATWRFRHCRAVVNGFAPDLFRCICPGSGLRREDPPRRCGDRASQEDRLCDACRRWCYAVDEKQHQHRFVDLYGAAT